MEYDEEAERRERGGGEGGVIGGSEDNTQPLNETIGSSWTNLTTGN